MPALPETMREIFFDGKAFPSVEIYNGDHLLPNSHIEGPAVVEYMGNTIVVHPGQVVLVDEQLNLVFDFGGQDD